MNPSTQSPEVDAKTPFRPSKEPAVDSGHPRYIVLWCLLAVAMVACNAVAAPLAQRFIDESVGFFIACLYSGIVMAQVGLLSAYIVWSSKPFWLRLIFHWLTAFLLYGVWIAGLLLLTNPRFSMAVIRRDALDFWCSIPYLALAVQMPPWCSRLLAGWRITRSLNTTERGWRIADFLVATSFVAVSLALLRKSGGADANLWGIAVIGGSVVAVASAMILLPTTWLVLGRFRLVSGLLLLLVYYLFLILAFVAAVRLIVRMQGFGANFPMQEYFFLCAPLIGVLGTVFTTFVLLRLSGYRLHRGRRAARGPEPIAIVEKAPD